MVKRTEHRTTEEILRIRHNLKIESRIEGLKLKFKNSPAIISNCRKGHIFLISDGMVRCITNISVPNVQPNNTPSPSSRNPDTHVELSVTSTYKPDVHLSTSINVHSPVHNTRRKKLRIHPASITSNQLYIQIIRTEMRRMQTEYIKYATSRMASASINDYILQNWK